MLFSNAGGGGERVLWAAIKATQDRWPNAVCVVYTGDHQSNKAEILDRVEVTFLDPVSSFSYFSLEPFRYKIALPNDGISVSTTARLGRREFISTFYAIASKSRLNCRGT